MAEDERNKDKGQCKKKGSKPSQEQIEEKRAERAAKKQREAEDKAKAEKLGVVGLGKNGRPLYAGRRWVSVKGLSDDDVNGRRIRIVSWNILAQGLVRRKLFPGSDCMKWKDRQPGLQAELVGHGWDVAAFQEVDRIESNGQTLQRSGRKYIYAKGYEDKQHGLLIAWRTSVCGEEAAGSKTIYFDRECVDGDAEKRGKRTALSRVTRNIALFVALRIKEKGEPKGILLATTHLFWHPMHAYERVRQTGILKRRLVEWRDQHPEWAQWPLIVAGDFNDQPHSATYKLVTGEQLTSHCVEEVHRSTVVHQSVDELAKRVEQDFRNKADATVANGSAAQANGLGGEGNTDGELQKEIEGSSEDEEEGEGGDGEGEEEEEGGDDQMLKNCRPASAEDGLLSFEEFIQLHDLSQPPPGSTIRHSSRMQSADELISSKPSLGLHSLYGRDFNHLEMDQSDNYFGSADRWRERHDDANWSPDAPNPHLDSSVEPMYTLFSSLFALTLDYIFVFPDKTGQQPAVTTSALLPTHKTSVLKPGVPRLGVCASDHTAIGAEIVM